MPAGTLCGKPANGTVVIEVVGRDGYPRIHESDNCLHLLDGRHSQFVDEVGVDIDILHATGFGYDIGYGSLGSRLGLIVVGIAFDEGIPKLSLVNFSVDIQLKVVNYNHEVGNHIIR